MSKIPDTLGKVPIGGEGVSGARIRQRIHKRSD
jgi:hypothetical protein